MTVASARAAAENGGLDMQCHEYDDDEDGTIMPSTMRGISPKECLLFSSQSLCRR